MRSSRLASQSSNRRGAPSAPKSKTESEAGTLRFQCPNTGREIDSGIGADCGARIISIRVRCPICEHLHAWRVADRNRCAVLSADQPSNDAQLNNAQAVHQFIEGRNVDIAELREELLEELNYRLKNNLQVLYGLLSIAWRKTDSPEAHVVLSDTCQRIGAMGSAQRVFYAARSSTEVSGQRLLEAVCDNARAFFGENVSINYEVISGSLPKETALPLALILNELLTNAARFGANEHGRVTITVGLSQRPGEIELYVQDRGSGFHFEEARGRSSGLGLVAMLAQRLKGTFKVERMSGARCVLTFPDQ
jgi:two-component sensor histidine kinase